MITHVLFDLGNVLEGPLDREEFEHELDELAHTFGFESGTAFWYHFYVTDAWENVKRGRISRDAFWKERFEALGITDPEAQERLWQRIFQYHGIFPLMRGVLDSLRDAGMPMSILSNTDRINLRNKLTMEYEIGHYFEHVISSAAVRFAKPDPEIYTYMLSTLDAAAESILFIDDQARNTRPAAALGIQTIVFETSHQALSAMEAYGLPVRST
jgi:HAD superfamily hydrolase (TIGR01509 family)